MTHAGRTGTLHPNRRFLNHNRDRPITSGDDAIAAVIDIRDATIRFGTFTAVNKVSLTVAPGQVFGLLGPNGSGKTSLIRALCGLLSLAEGSAAVLGYDVGHQPKEIRSSIGYMSQQFSLYEDLTARENMEFYSGIYRLPTPLAHTRQAELIELTGLGRHLGRRAGRLSGGWKQRLALACSLLHRPRLVFLDEPTAGIDPVARRDLWNLLFRLSADGITLFVTTHYMDEAERCTSVGYLYLGHMLAVGTPDELKRLPEVTPPHTRRWEVIGPDITVLLEQLRNRPGVYEATIFGQAIHLLMDEKNTPDGMGFEGMRMRPIEASLEDVFVALTRLHASDNA